MSSLSVELERALLRELASHYDWQAYQQFKNTLKRPLLALAEMTTKLGCWIPATRTIQLSRTFVIERPWPEITSVLEHEMAHQYVDEVLNVRDETAHGETFRKVCADRGIDARAAGTPLAAPDAPSHALDRIRKLLALAGSANQHEAELAMKKAHELMLRHNLEVTSTRAAAGYEVVHVGDPSRRGTRVESDIIVLLDQLFFVKAIRVPVYLVHEAKRGWVYELLGTPANLEMAVHVHAFLLATVERLWEANRNDMRVMSGRDRLAYQCGVVAGFRDKLERERTDLASGEEGLVWIGDAELDRLYRRRHPSITTRRTRQKQSGAHRAGREAGQQIVLHKPVSHGPSGTTRLLKA